MLRLERRDRLIAGCFTAMACDCEILIETDDVGLAGRLAERGMAECLRIEQKFSRYRDDNIVHRIHQSAGEVVEVDEETADLLDFAKRCWQISNRRFDITSGILRNAWHFDGVSRPPTAQEIEDLLPRIGWQKLLWRRPWLMLPSGMEIDFGGIGKEYAVDQVLALLTRETDLPMLVNFGGDLACNGPQQAERPWSIGIGHPDRNREAVETWQLSKGALATSGDAHRFIIHEGVRYGHVLDPRNGWPAPGAPRSVTVAAARCLDAGILSTLALLHGEQAEDFLEAQQVVYRILL